MQLTPKEVYNYIMQIRYTADNNGFVVKRNRVTDWKSWLLSCISNTVVLQHLKCLQPFQYYASLTEDGARVHLFRINFYKDNIYLKVNMITY